jgi:hypothetical protein
LPSPLSNGIISSVWLALRAEEKKNRIKEEEGSCTGKHGDYNSAVLVASEGNVTLLDVTALAENGNVENSALLSYGDAAVQGGVYTGHGSSAFGLSNINGTLRAESVTALGEGGGASAGLKNSSGATATLRGGSFTGRGGNNAYGLWNDYSASLEAEGVIARGGSASTSYGLYNRYDSSTVTVSQSTLEGATSPAVRGGGSGAVSLYHSRLISDNPVSGDVACVAVSRGTSFGSTSCPYGGAKMKALNLLMVGLVLWLAVAGVAGASGSVNRPREVMASGGTSATAGSVTLQATVGQPFVGARTAADVHLSQGFWPGQEARYLIYLPVVLKEQS